MSINFRDILNSPESELLDFKLKHHADAVEMVHDILCLANARGRGDRYLVFGVSDNPREVKGVPSDNRRTLADVAQNLRQFAISRMPDLKLEEVSWEGKLVDVLLIGDRPEKPYVLGRDYTFGRKTVRCGVVYTRHADTNTPMNESASQAEIEIMYRQRMGLDLSPMERFPLYLADKSGWERSEDHQGEFHYYRPFPEFTIRDVEREFFGGYTEPWHLHHPDNRATKHEYALSYYATVLQSVTIVWCDGARYSVPIPHIHIVQGSGSPGATQCFYQLVGDLGDLVNKVVTTKVEDRASAIRAAELPKFSSVSEAELTISEDWVSKERRLTYYRRDESKNCDVKIDGMKLPIELPKRRQ